MKTVIKKVFNKRVERHNVIFLKIEVHLSKIVSRRIWKSNRENKNGIWVFTEIL